LYKEALDFARQNIDDFRVDPLLNLHINHNLAELLRTSSEYLQECPLKVQTSVLCYKRKRNGTSPAHSELCGIKRNKISENSGSDLAADGAETSEDINIIGQASTSVELDAENNAGCHSSSECFADGCLRKTCNTLKEKYLSVFTTKLLIAQKDFSASMEEVGLVTFLLFLWLQLATSNLDPCLLFFLGIFYVLL
jgi:E3 ubiquitin-protein ligase SHPRH